MSYSFVNVSIAFRIIIHVELKISSNQVVEGIKSFVKAILQLEAVSLLLRISLYLNDQHPDQILLNVCVWLQYQAKRVI